MRSARLFFLALLCLVLFSPATYAKPLVADLSQYRIEIDSSFTGTRLLLFGARNDIGDIVIVVRGPNRQFVVRRKERVAGLWVNRKQQHFDNVPTFYTLAASKSFQDMHASPLFASLRIGLQEAVTGNDKNDDTSFVDALIHSQQSQRLYSQNVQKVSFMGESLFKFVIPFPDNIPGGDYVADIYLFNDGQLSSMQSIPLHVEKIGFDAFISDFAYSHSVFYGFFAILLALFIGWGASSLMQKL